MSSSQAAVRRWRFTFATATRAHHRPSSGSCKRSLGQVCCSPPQAGEAAPVAGREPGTFALELAHLGQAERGPDIVLSFPWDSSPNAFGVAGTNYAAAGRETGPISGAGPVTAPQSVDHTQHVHCLGRRFQARHGRQHAGEQCGHRADLARADELDRGIVPAGFDGRVLSEAFVDGPDGEQVPVQARRTRRNSGWSYRAALQVTELGRQLYIDKGWRVR